jgi:TolB protein
MLRGVKMRLWFTNISIFVLLITVLLISGCEEGSLSGSANGNYLVLEHSLSWSPDSSMLAYISNSSVVVKTISTNKVKQLTGTGYYDDPAWSPDNTKIAYTTSAYDARADIWIKNSDGSDIAQRFISDTSADFHPRWSPDGKWIAFHSYRNGTMDIWLRPSDSSAAETRIASNPAADQNAEWSPDGTKLAFESKRAVNTDIAENFDIWVVDPHGTNKPVQITKESSNDTLPQWSHDGSKIAFHSDRFSLDGIWVINSDETGDAVHVTYGFAEASKHNWSADDKYIAFISSDNMIYAKRSDGTGDAITIGKGLEPHFSPDGMKMAYIADESNQYILKVIDLPPELK